jgi:hypothetical protein
VKQDLGLPGRLLPANLEHRLPETKSGYQGALCIHGSHHLSAVACRPECPSNLSSQLRRSDCELPNVTPIYTPFLAGGVVSVELMAARTK